MKLSLPMLNSPKSAIFDPRDYGATGDGRTFDTVAVQQAIDACSDAGGGRVLLDGGVFLVKPIQLKNGVELHLGRNGRLLGSGDWRDYPNRGNMRHVISENLPRGRDAALIWADEAERIAITGTGTIDANGMSFMRLLPDAENKKWKYERIGGFEQSPPRVVFLAGCRDVIVKDILLTNQPGGWGFWVHDCDRVVFDHCRIEADVSFPNNDGIHINSCRDVEIANCTIETGDDAIVVRCNNRSLHERKVCERVTVKSCKLRSYANCIRVAWCKEGVIRDCTFSDLVFHDSTVGINIWFVPQDWNPAGDYGIEKTLVERLSFSNIVMERIHHTPITVRVFEPAGDGCEAIRDITFSNVTCRAYGEPCFRGAGTRPLENFAFRNCRFIRDEAAIAPWEDPDKPRPAEPIFQNCRNFTFDGCTVDDFTPKPFN